MDHTGCHCAKGKVVDQHTSMGNQTGDTNSSAAATRSRRIWPWFALAGGLLAVLLIVGAAIAIPKYLHAQRVAAYSATMEQVETVSSETHRLLEEATLLTVLYALQFDEVEKLQVDVKELSDFSDHYFSDEDRAALSQASDALLTVLEDKSMNEEETAVTDSAQQAIATHGYVWQTDFLNLSTDSVYELVETSEKAPIVLVAEDDVTDEVVEHAKADLKKAEAALLEAEQKFTVASDRAEGLTTAIVSALKPLNRSALSAPDQAEVVLDMYPDADTDVVKLLRGSAEMAKASVTAELFTFDDDYNPIPVMGEIADDAVSFSTTEAWRAVIISSHLMNYSGAITGAWISDAGSLEEALGFNPYLPFF